jgi:hypothetical protein
MNYLTSRTILIVYLFLAFALGIAAFFFGGASSLPDPTNREQVEEFKKTISDPVVGKVYDNVLSDLRDRQRRISDSMIGGFSTVIGALIGFLSASWANGKKRKRKKPDSNKKNTQPLAQSNEQKQIPN